MDHPPRESVLGRKVMRASPHKYCGEAAATTLKFESRDE